MTTWSLVSKPSLGAAQDGVYAPSDDDGAITEPPGDGAYAPTGDGWTPAYTLYDYAMWTLSTKPSDSGLSGVLANPGEAGALIEPGEVGVVDASNMWTLLTIPD